MTLACGYDSNVPFHQENDCESATESDCETSYDEEVSTNAREEASENHCEIVDGAYSSPGRDCDDVGFHLEETDLAIMGDASVVRAVVLRPYRS